MKVLVVDDNKNDRMLISKMLSVRGYDVLEARNGVDALRLIENVIFDLIISDINMPGMDGLTLLLRLKKNSKTNIIPFVFYTATFVNDEDRELGLSLGASRYFLKPLEPKMFLYEIETLLKEFKAGDLKPKRPKITEEDYLEKYNERISQMLESEINRIDLEIEKRKIAEEALQEQLNERQKGEEQLRLASLYARSLIEASLDPFVTINRNGKITDVNKATEEVTGVARDQLIGTDFSNYFTKPEKAREGYQEVFRKGLVRDYPLAIRHRSGITTDVLYNATVYRNEHGKVEGVFAAARDITERKKAEEQLRSASLYARSLIEASLDPLVTISPDGKITDVNKATENITGVQRWDLINSDFSEYFTDPAKARAGYKEVFFKGFVRDYPLAIRHISGSTTDVLYNATVYRNEAGEVKGVFAAARDITERKRAEDAMKVAKEEAQHASRIKSEFLEKMSHELRTPLNAILGFNELMRMKTMGELNQKQEHYVNNISNSAKHLLGIINDMLDLVKVESGENLPLSIESFNAPEAIDETLIFVQEKALQKNIIIRKEIEPELTILSADKIRFKQILLNFLDNAIKFSKPEGGTISIAARKTGDMAQFSVCDTGIGIREEEMGKLFSLFYQADSGRSRKYGGTGVGLAIIKQLVEQHGGTLWVKSKYGEGSTFTFKIPLVTNKEENK